MDTEGNKAYFAPGDKIEAIDLCKSCNTIKHLNENGLCERCEPNTNTELAKLLNRQYLSGGGFCGGCGEAVPPFIKDLPDDVVESACPTQGECEPHIDCLGCGRYVKEGMTPGYCYDCIDDSGDGPAKKETNMEKNDTDLRKKVRLYVSALSSSGNNFVVAGSGEEPPISSELIEDYVNSLMQLITSHNKKLELSAKLEVLNQLVAAYNEEPDQQAEVRLITFTLALSKEIRSLKAQLSNLEGEKT